MSAWKRSLVLVTLFAAAGCYTYRPVRPGDALPEARVRATVSAQQAAELAPVMRGVTSSVSGTLVERSDDRILVEVPIYGATAGMSAAPLRNRVAIPLSELVTLETRTLSKWRTGLAIGAVAAAVGGTWVAVSGRTSVEDKGKPGTNNAILSTFRIPLGVFR